MQVIIHEIKVEGKCRAVNVSFTKIQSNESKAFLRSTFRVHLGEDLFLLYFRKSSYKRNILSIMALFWMKAAWAGSMMLVRAGASLEAIIFEITL